MFSIWGVPTLQIPDLVLHLQQTSFWIFIFLMLSSHVWLVATILGGLLLYFCKEHPPFVTYLAVINYLTSLCLGFLICQVKIIKPYLITHNTLYELEFLVTSYIRKCLRV